MLTVKLYARIRRAVLIDVLSQMRIPVDANAEWKAKLSVKKSTAIS